MCPQPDSSNGWAIAKEVPKNAPPPFHNFATMRSVKSHGMVPDEPVLRTNRIIVYTLAQTLSRSGLIIGEPNSPQFCACGEISYLKSSP